MYDAVRDAMVVVLGMMVDVGDSLMLKSMGATKVPAKDSVLDGSNADELDDDVASDVETLVLVVPIV